MDGDTNGREVSNAKKVTFSGIANMAALERSPIHGTLWVLVFIGLLTFFTERCNRDSAFNIF